MSLDNLHSQQSLKFLKQCNAEDQKLIAKQSELNLDGESQVCLRHEALLLTKFEFLQKTCCDPFKKKCHLKRKDLRPITVATAEKMSDMLKVSIKPGQKLCTSCRKEFDSKQVSESSSTESDGPADNMEICESVNTSLSVLGISPIKYQPVNARDKHGYAKSKISQAQEIIAEQIAAIGNIDSQNLLVPSSSQHCTNCQDFNKLIEEMKLKFQVAKRQEKIQTLTLVPQS
ncbi:ARL14 effector protein-like [Procambarus clarkii]|uniref:ARL14 effector protein-like n=1 Tax=Procambarus clarkii TaxID=6728 RepID=UPI003741FFF5